MSVEEESHVQVFGLDVVNGGELTATLEPVLSNGKFRRNKFRVTSTDGANLGIIYLSSDRQHWRWEDHFKYYDSVGQAACGAVASYQRHKANCQVVPLKVRIYQNLVLTDDGILVGQLRPWAKRSSWLDNYCRLVARTDASVAYLSRSRASDFWYQHNGPSFPSLNAAVAVLLYNWLLKHWQCKFPHTAFTTTYCTACFYKRHEISYFDSASGKRQMQTFVGSDVSAQRFANWLFRQLGYQTMVERVNYYGKREPCGYGRRRRS